MTHEAFLDIEIKRLEFLREKLWESPEKQKSIDTWIKKLEALRDGKDT